MHFLLTGMQHIFMFGYCFKYWFVQTMTSDTLVKYNLSQVCSPLFLRDELYLQLEIVR